VYANRLHVCVTVYYRYHHGFYMRGSDHDCWNRNGWVAAHCIAITTYWYPHGWNFVGGWNWMERAAVVADFNGDGMQDFARWGGTYVHLFISRVSAYMLYDTVYMYCTHSTAMCICAPSLMLYLPLLLSQGNGHYNFPIYHFPAGWNFHHAEHIWSTLPPGDFDGDGREGMRTRCACCTVMLSCRLIYGDLTAYVLLLSLCCRYHPVVLHVQPRLLPSW